MGRIENTEFCQFILSNACLAVSGWHFSNIYLTQRDQNTEQVWFTYGPRVSNGQLWDAIKKTRQNPGFQMFCHSKQQAIWKSPQILRHAIQTSDFSTHQISANNSTWYCYSKINRKSGNIYRASTWLRSRNFNIRLKNEPLVGTPIHWDLVRISDASWFLHQSFIAHLGLFWLDYLNKDF